MRTATLTLPHTRLVNDFHISRSHDLLEKLVSIDTIYNAPCEANTFICMRGNISFKCEFVMIAHC